MRPTNPNVARPPIVAIPNIIGFILASWSIKNGLKKKSTLLITTKWTTNTTIAGNQLPFKIKSPAVGNVTKDGPTRGMMPKNILNTAAKPINGKPSMKNINPTIKPLIIATVNEAKTILFVTIDILNRNKSVTLSLKGLNLLIKVLILPMLGTNIMKTTANIIIFVAKGTTVVDRIYHIDSPIVRSFQN